MSYRFRPKGDRTPVSDPVFGHLHWDGEYDDPRCAGDPRFEEIKKGRAKPNGNGENSAPADPPADTGGETPADEAGANAEKR